MSNLDNYNPYQAPTAPLDPQNDSGNFDLADPPNRLPIGAGADWVVQSWRIFKARPLLWLGLLGAYVLFVIALVIASLIPIIGFFINIAIGIFMPMLMAGVYYIAYGIDTDGDVSFGDVFMAFKAGKIGDYFMLWLWQFLLTIALAIPAMILMFVLGAIGLDPEQSGLGVALVGLIILALALPLAMMAVFSPILILFHDMKAWDAMKLSMRACFANMLPFLVYGLIFVVLFLVASIPFGLGLLVVVPMAMASLYVAYRQILTNDA